MIYVNIKKASQDEQQKQTNNNNKDYLHQKIYVRFKK